MSTKNSQFHANSCPANTYLDIAVMLKIGGFWIAVETADQAWQCLQQWVGDRSGPSYSRALVACQALLKDEGSAEAASSTLVVAAMEAGISFEVHDDSGALMERQLALAAERGVLDMMLEDDSIERPGHVAIQSAE